MGNFDELIQSLKKNIHSLPSEGGSPVECVPVEETAAVVAAVQPPPPSEQTLQQYRYDAHSSRKTRCVRWFVRHGLLTVEFFFFFLILLVITKPSFLYYNERVVYNGRELLRTHFSSLYLVSYSIFFTCIFHVLIIVHQDLVKRY